MTKLFVRAAMAAALVSVAPAAYAATSITFAPTAPDGSISGTFSDEGIAAGQFDDLFNFTFPRAGTAAATISSIFTISTNNNVDFTSVLLNGVEFAVGSTGTTEFRFLANQPVAAGAQTLRVRGTSGGNGSFAGTISFAPTATAVPEPATWAMMIGGFGVVGGAMRRRRASGLATA